MFSATTSTPAIITPPTLPQYPAMISPEEMDAALSADEQVSHSAYEPFSPSFALKSRRTTPDSEVISCASTRALFDLEDLPSTPFSVSPPSRADSPFSPMRSTSIAPSKRHTSRASSPASFSESKKPRARVTTKDFVPPDVSGLSKREARLVKNRAAAFLSRQRKREEFECMEIRVAELEQENARLRSQTEPETSQPEALLDEIEQLRAQLAAAEQRTSELNARLSSAQASQQPAVKLEPVDTDEFPSAASSPGRRSRSSSVSSQKPERSGANLGLMVLLCALPSLLSNPSALSAQQSLSLPLTSTSMAVPSSLPFTPSGDFDFPSSLMDIDGADSFASSFNDAFGFDFDGIPPSAPSSAFTSARASPAPSGNTLGFIDGARLGLGNLDISFESAREDGKIRVKIHPPSAASSRPSTPPAGYSPPHDPFLGVGEVSDEINVPFSRAGSPFEFADKRRVRIALKSMPTSEGEGGEWEVELC